MTWRRSSSGWSGIAQGEYGFAQVNVERQRHDPHSLLNWMERVTRRRKECPAFGLGDCSFIDTGLRHVLAHRCEYQATKCSRTAATRRISSPTAG